MRRAFAALALIAAVGGVGLAQDAAGAPRAKPQLTPVVVAPLSFNSPSPVIGTDGLLHVLYELEFTNTQSVPAVLQSVDVRGVNPRGSVVILEGAELAGRLRRLDAEAVPDTVIEPFSHRLLLVDLTFTSLDEVPIALQHRVTIAPTDPAGVARINTVARVEVAIVDPLTLGPPVLGSNWVVTNGCCTPASSHRSAILPTDGGLSAAERFGIDFRQLDDTGRFVQGDPAQLESYAGYGTDVLAVAPGRVVAVVDTFSEQVPGSAAAPGTFPIDMREGNSVVVDLGNGTFAFYGQLQAGSIIVGPGDRVRRGQALARLGNSGDGASPHLHFHLMNAESVVGADGVPFVLNRFSYSGQIDPEQLATLGILGEYANNRFAIPMPRARQLPLDLAILDFGQSPGSSGNPLA